MRNMLALPSILSMQSGSKLPSIVPSEPEEARSRFLERDALRQELPPKWQTDLPSLWPRSRTNSSSFRSVSNTYLESSITRSLRDREDGAGQDDVHGEDDPTHLGYGRPRNSNLLFLPDLHSLNLFKGQLVPRSIINPGGRRTRMSGDPLRDLDCTPRIHVFGNARRTEAVTTNSFQDPASLRPFLNQL
jgi:hypothetical protein